MTDSIITAVFYAFLAFGTVASVLFIGLMIADDIKKEDKK